MIYTITLNPAIDKAVRIDNFRTDEVNRVLQIQEDPGGKGINVSNMVHRLHGDSVAIMVTGGHNGERLVEMVADLGIRYEAIPCEGETRINVKVADPVRKTFTDINEPGPHIGDRELTAVSDYLKANLKVNDLVTMAGSIPKGVPTDIYAKWILLAKEKGAKVILDASGEALKLGIKQRPYLIKPNQEELEDYYDAKLKTDRDIAECGKILCRDGIGHVVVSQGSQGCLVISGEKVAKISPLKIDLKSTVGAGDSMVAAIALSLEEVLKDGEPDFEEIIDIVAYGAAASSASIEQPGTVMGSFDRVEELYEEINRSEWQPA